MALDIDAELLREFASRVIAQLEGPYKTHIMIGAGLVLTALVMRFIFKSFKWVILLAFLITLIIGSFYLVFQWIERTG